MSGFTMLFVVYIALCIGDAVIAVRSFLKREPMGINLGIMSVATIVATLCYLGSLTAECVRLHFFFKGTSLICTDLALLALLGFSCQFTDRRKASERKVLWWALAAFLVADVFVMHMGRSEGAASSVHTASYLHTGYNCALVVIVLVQMVRRGAQLPALYRMKYRYSTLTVIVLAVLMALRMIESPGSWVEQINVSLIGYSLTCMLMYWNVYVFATGGLLSYFRRWAFDSVDQGILLYDNEGRLLLKNARAVAMLPKELFTGETGIEAFLTSCGLAGKPGTESFSAQCFIGGQPTRCDCAVQNDQEGRLLGKLYTFLQQSTRYDILTGFRLWSNLKDEAEALFPEDFMPVTVSVCDINSLSDYNRKYGMERGDRLVKSLADALRECFPSDSVFVRGREAYLAVLCSDMSIEGARRRMAKVRELMRECAPADANVRIQDSIAVERDPALIVDAIRKNMQSIHNKKLMDKTSVHSEVLFSLVQALEQCDNDTSAHVRRTQRMGADLGKRLGLSDLDLSNLALLAILHDIGKIGIPLEILNKPGKLTKNEWEVLKTHVQKGYRIACSSNELSGIADMILYHHELWDGNGYPDGLSGDAIPLLSRIIAVVDAYDAMTYDRSYRKRIPPAAARAELQRCAGTQFDPNVVRELLQMLEEQDREQGVVHEPVPEDVAPVKDVPRGAEPQMQWSTDDPMRMEKLRVHAMRYSRYILDNDRRIIEMDDAFEALTGYSPEEVLQKGMTQFDLIFEEDAEDYMDQVSEALGKYSRAYLEHRIRRKDGKVVYVYCMGRVFYDSAAREQRSEIIVSDTAHSYAVQTMVELGQDKAVRELRRAEDKCRRDPITGLMSPEPFRTDVELRLIAGNAHAMMLRIELDDFAAYKQAHGARAADEALIFVGQMLVGSMRGNDLAGRVGECEFGAALFFEKVELKEIMIRRVQQICDRINMIQTFGRNPGVTVSIGCAFSDEEHNSCNALYDAAGAALARARKNGAAQFSL